MTGKEIYDLIKGLDAPTKNSFARYCKSAYSSSGWLHLYRQITNAKTFNEARIRGRKLLSNKAYWSARMQLLRHLLTNIYLSRQKGDLLEDDRLLIANDLCMFDFLTNQLKREFLQARGNGRIWRLMELEKIREKLRMISVSSSNEIFSDEEAAEAMGEAEEIAACNQAILQIRILIRSEIINMDKRNALAGKIEEKLRLQVIETPVVYSCRLRALAKAAILRMDYAQAALLQQKLVQHLLSVSTGFDSAKLIDETSKFITILVSLNHVDQARKYFNILQNIVPKTQFEKNLKKRVAGEVGITLATEQFDLKLFKISLGLVDEKHGRFNYYQILGATLAFYVGDFPYSIKMLRSVIDMPRDTWAVYSWYLLPMEALARYEQGHIDFAETLISRMRAKKNFGCEYTELMISTLNSLIMCAPNQCDAKLKIAYEKFQVYADTGEGKAKVPLFDFGVWILSRMNPFPMSDIILNRKKTVHYSPLVIGEVQEI